MAGGIGSRFWPMSTTDHPKQFLDILGTGKTLIQQTYNRFTGICPKENIFIITNERYKDLVVEQLKIDESRVISEPARKNTAPCIAYASYKIQDINPDANIVVAPSDHLILKEDAFAEIIHIALNKTKHDDCLVTLGIKPSRPDTGYGYIQFNNTAPTSGDIRIRKVKTFTEKPSLQTAMEFLESGDFCWNSGIFVWRISSIITALDKHLSGVSTLFKEGTGKYNTPKEAKFIQKIYQLCKNISIDYAVMEKADNVYVVLSDFGWSDLGTWRSLYENAGNIQAGEANAVTGKNVFMYDSKNCIVNMPDDKLAVLQGLDDYIVVDANNILLVCKKQDEQKIKQIVNDINTKKR